jgi:multiple sugar transport system permease protein
LLLLVVALVASLMLFPIYWMVMTAIMPSEMILSRNPSLVPDPSRFSLASFYAVFESGSYLRWLLYSIIVALCSTLASMVIAFLAGYSLSRWTTPSHQFLGGSLLISKIIPGALIIIPFFVVYVQFGLIDSYLGLVLVNMTIGVPLATWMLKGFIDRIPQEIDQVAKLDGCSEFQLLRLVIIPLSAPGLAAVSIYLVIVSWSEFIFARTLMQSEEKRVLTVGLQSFMGEHLVDWPHLMAAGTISLLPLIVLFVVLEPFLVSGMTKGSLAN